jgi:hypothetical protein
MASRQLNNARGGTCSFRRDNARQAHFSIAVAAARQQQHRAAVISQAVSGHIDINEIYTSSGSISTPYVGPVKAVRLKGKYSSGHGCGMWSTRHANTPSADCSLSN